MKKMFVIGLAMVMIMFGMVGVSNAIIINFDDYPGTTQNSTGSILGSYHGFNFTGSENQNMIWIDTVGSPIWDRGAISGDFTMLNNWSGSAVITSSTNEDFTFDGLHARIWRDNQPDRDVSMEGYLNGTLTWTTVGMNLTTSWAHFSGAPSNLMFDELRLNLGNYFLIDDLALNEIGGPAPVPEPCTMLLMGTGLAGMVVTRMRKKKE